MAKTSKSVWAFDPTWTRVEHLDDEGASLGYVTFERRVSTPNPRPQTSLPRSLTGAVVRVWFALAATFRRRSAAAT